MRSAYYVQLQWQTRSYDELGLRIRSMFSDSVKGGSSLTALTPAKRQHRRRGAGDGFPRTRILQQLAGGVRFGESRGGKFRGLRSWG